jgi:glycosyltransferase involved in cell wall biosynthesis
MSNLSHPFLSVLTPTYNRRKFLQATIECYKAFDYPKSRMEWIILDDGEDCVKDVFDEAAKTIPNLRYIRHEGEKLLIGAKRNRLNKEAKGDILVAMDDDDYYPPDRMKHVVYKFANAPKVELAGSSEIYIYFTSTKDIYKLGPYRNNHATNGTMAWRKSYALSHTYDETVTHAEERSFLEDYKYPMIQLDPFKTMLVMSHSSNTFDKSSLITQANQNPFVKDSSLKLKNFIKSSTLRKFYESA